MSAPVLGNFFGIYLYGQRIAFAQGKTVSIKTKVEDITTSDSYGNEEILPVDHSLSANVDGLITASLDNVLNSPEVLDNVDWVPDSTTTVESYHDTDNFGFKHSNRVTWNSGSSIFQIIEDLGVATGWGSCWLKGNGRVKLRVYGENEFETTVDLTNEWVRYSVYCDSINTSDEVWFMIEKVTGTYVDIANCMYNTGLILLDYKGSQYMAKYLMSLEAGRTKFPIRYSNDLEGDMQIDGYAYITNFELKTKNDVVNKFSCTLTATGLNTITTF